MDHLIGQIIDKLRELDLFDNTLIVVDSDHGDHLGDHGQQQKGFFFESAVRTPFVFAGPAVQNGKDRVADGNLLLDRVCPVPARPERASPEQTLVLAVVRQESAYYYGALSGAGAHELMQIQTRTAKSMARRLKVRFSRKKLRADPEYNMLLGRAYLTDLTDRYDGSYVLALAAYNAGPSRANKWIRTFGDPRDADVNPIDLIESIPFDETRNYVQRILEGLIIYRQQLGIEGPTVDPFANLPAPATALAVPVDRDESFYLSCCL